MWYVAELVMKIVVAGDPRNVVHQNLHLVEASSPEEAYAKALEVGRRSETSYDNPEGRRVKITFEGLSDLDELYQEPEDGAEIAFHQRVGVSEEELRSLVLPKERLRVFRPPSRTEGPDYSSGEVLALAMRKLRGRVKRGGGRGHR